MSKIFIVPEPYKLEFKGRYFPFNGFENFPEFLSKEFNIPKGNFKIKKIEREGIGISIKDGEIEIWGDENICYATIIQILKQNKDLPELEIHEKFNFSFRGYHLDIARGGVPNLKTFKDILKWLFILKYNYFAIYFEDLFPWRKYPQIGALRGRLTEDELKEIIEYGKKLGIEVFPSLELTGHMEHILKLPIFYKFSEWHRPEEGCLDVSNDSARNFAYDLLNEVLDFFPSKFIHIGGDETWALGRGKSLDKSKVFEGPSLYEMHHTKMVNMVKKRGKEAILWGDMLTGMYLREEERKYWKVVLESKIWDEVYIANWDYSPSPKEHFKEKINMFGERKKKEIASPGFSNWLRYYPNFYDALENIRNFISIAKEEKLPGFLVTAWGDDGEECLFSFLNPLLLATMEIAEGNEKWEEKWSALTGEDMKIVYVRKIFGNPLISDTFKYVLFKDLYFRYFTEIEKHPSLLYIPPISLSYYKFMGLKPPYEEKDLRIVYQNVLDETENINLPKDLNFIRTAIKVALRRLKGEANASSYIELANIYAQLWLEERKLEGLENIITRFWGSAGRIDLKII